MQSPRVILAFVRQLHAIGLGLFLFSSSLVAQLQQGTIFGRVVGPDGGAITEATVALIDHLGNTVTSVTASNGEFRIPDVAPGSYSLRADAAPFLAVLDTLTVTDARPIKIELRLSAVLAEQVMVTEETSQPVSTAAIVTLAGDAVRRAPIRISSSGLQDASATTPGWAMEDNGLLHARGVDDGFLYVIDGVPMYERMDSMHGVARSGNGGLMNVITGHMPPEFGFKAGGVTKCGIEPQKRLMARQRAGEYRYRRNAAGIICIRRADAWVDVAHFWKAGQRSNRFLDPSIPTTSITAANAVNARLELGGLFPPRARLRCSVASADRALTCPTTKSSRNEGRTSGSAINRPGRPLRGSAPGRLPQCLKSPGTIGLGRPPCWGASATRRYISVPTER